jgi:hypothetical protein
MQSGRSEHEFHLISALNSKYHRCTQWIPIRVKGEEKKSLPDLAVVSEDNEKDFMDGF